jgi:hypothetical protein
VVIEWGHGIEREETGLRGIATLITNGLIRKPGHYRIDPMQRSIEIDGVTFECNEAGVKRLEEALNTRYAPSAQGNKTAAIEIKENLAASTGFDIHFRTTHAGVTHDIKGHLTQELLDILQDPLKCDLIQPGIHLLLSPPNLLIRRRRSDMGEEKIPELPDVNLLRLTSVQLQQIINHPLIRRNAGAAAARSAPTAEINRSRSWRCGSSGIRRTKSCSGLSASHRAALCMSRRRSRITTSLTCNTADAFCHTWSVPFIGSPAIEHSRPPDAQRGGHQPRSAQ